MLQSITFRIVNLGLPIRLFPMGGFSLDNQNFSIGLSLSMTTPTMRVEFSSHVQTLCCTVHVKWLFANEMRLTVCSNIDPGGFQKKFQQK